MDDRVKCRNVECGWEGKRSQCVHFTHDPYQTDFCPVCEMTVDEVNADSASDHTT